jgi:hypothetical protein
MNGDEAPKNMAVGPVGTSIRRLVRLVRVGAPEWSPDVCDDLGYGVGPCPACGNAECEWWCNNGEKLHMKSPRCSSMRPGWAGDLDGELVGWCHVGDGGAVTVMGMAAEIEVQLWWQQAAWFVSISCLLQDDQVTCICHCVFCSDDFGLAKELGEAFKQIRHTVAASIDGICRSDDAPDWDNEAGVDGFNEFVKSVSRRVSDLVYDSLEASASATGHRRIQPTREAQLAEFKATPCLWTTSSNDVISRERMKS